MPSILEKEMLLERRRMGKFNRHANENIMYDFVKMVRDGVAPTADLAAAVRVQGLAEAIELSGKLKRSIELDSDGVPCLE